MDPACIHPTHLPHKNYCLLTCEDQVGFQRLIFDLKQHTVSIGIDIETNKAAFKVKAKQPITGYMRLLHFN